MKMKLYTLGLMLCLAGASFGQAKKSIDVKRGTPVVDGDVDAAYEMTNTITTSINGGSDNVNNCSAEPAPGTPPNNTTTFGVLWDNDFLYLAVKVLDAEVMPGDAIEVFFSPSNSNKATDGEMCANIGWFGGLKPGYDSGDGQYIIRAKTAAGESQMEGVNNTKVDMSKYEWKTIPGGFVMEAAIAFKDMTYPMKQYEDPETGETKSQFDINVITEGYKMGLDVFNSDADFGGVNIQGAWNKCCSNRNWAESIGFGEITFRGQRPLSTNTTKDMKNILSSLALYPNPANSGKVEVNLTAVTTETVKVSLVNSLSENLYSTDLKLVPGQNIVPVSVSELSNGLYYIMVSNGKSVTSQKLVVAK